MPAAIRLSMASPNVSLLTNPRVVDRIRRQVRTWLAPARSQGPDPTPGRLVNVLSSPLSPSSCSCNGCLGAGGHADLVAGAVIPYHSAGGVVPLPNRPTGSLGYVPVASHQL